MSLHPLTVKITTLTKITSSEHVGGGFFWGFFGFFAVHSQRLSEVFLELSLLLLDDLGCFKEVQSGGPKVQ